MANLPGSDLSQNIKRAFAIADATSLTEAGYVGEDVENILLKLIQAADYDIERAEKELSTSMKLIKYPVNQKIRQLPVM